MASVFRRSQRKYPTIFGAENTTSQAHHRAPLLDNPLCGTRSPARRFLLASTSRFGQREEIRMRDALVGARSFLIVLLALLFAVPATAQTGGMITGTIRDAQGGVLPGVTLSLRNAESGVTRSAVTESDGTYRLQGVPPGRYELVAELAGFANAEYRDITITIGLSLQRDVTMSLQTLQESVTVTAEAPVIEVTRTDVAQVITAGADRYAADVRPSAGQPRAAAAGHQHGQHAGAAGAGEHRGGRHQQPDERLLRGRRLELVARTPASSTPRCR